LAGRGSRSRRATELEEQLLRENEELKARLKKEEEEERSSRISGVRTTKDGKTDIAIEL